MVKKFEMVFKMLLGIFVLAVYAYIGMGLMIIPMIALNHSFILGVLATVMSVVSMLIIIKILLTE